MVNPMQPVWHDAAGRDLQPGQLVAYPTGSRSSHSLKFGIVLELVSKPNKMWERNPNDPKGGGRYVDYLQPKVKVIDTIGHKSVHEYIEKMLIVEDHQVPQEKREALRGFYAQTQPISFGE